MKVALSILLSSLLLASACAHMKPPDATAYLGNINAPCLDRVREDATRAPGAPNCAAFKADLLGLDRCNEVDAECPSASNLLRDLFGETRRKKFANYIVYFDQRDTPGKFVRHQSVLMWNDKNSRYLSGVQEVYIVLLTEHKTCFDAHLTMIARSEPNPFELVLKAMGKTFGSPEVQAQPKTHLAHLAWYPLSGDVENPVMWLAMGAVPVDVNTTDWITVRFTEPVLAGSEAAKIAPDECIADPAKGHQGLYKGDFLAHNAFFSNNRSSRIGLGVAFGATWTRRGAVPQDGGGGNPSVNAYGLGKVYPFPHFRPRLRADPESDGSSTQVRTVAFVLGTNINGTFFNDLIGGVSLGHVLGNVGLVGGVNYFAPTKESGRRTRPFFAFDYSF